MSNQAESSTQSLRIQALRFAQWLFILLVVIEVVIYAISSIFFVLDGQIKFEIDRFLRDKLILAFLHLIPAYFLFKKWFPAQLSTWDKRILFRCIYALAIIYFIYGLSQYFNPTPAVTWGADLYRQGHLKALLITIVLAPIIEEVMIRGVLFHCMEDLSKNFAKDSELLQGTLLVGTSSLVFGIIHAQYGLSDQIFIVVVGIVLGYARLQTRALLVPIILHGFAAILAFCVIKAITS